MNNGQPYQRSYLPWVVVLIIVFLLVSSCSLTVWLGLDKTFSFIEGFNSGLSRKAQIKGDKVIAYLTVDGVISGGRDELFQALEEIEDGVEDKKISGLLIFINSPGGSVAPTQDLYHRVLELRKSIPVVCALGDVAASGGFYLATACEQIYAQPGTTTGSIGVIFQLFNLEDLAHWAKVKPLTIKSGKLKDIASPFRPMTDDEKHYLQNLLDQVHEQFIRDVAKGRAGKITDSKLREVADGRIFTGEAAVQLGLVDKLGGARDALAYLRDIKKLGHDLKVIRLPKPRRSLESLFTSSQSQNFFEQLGKLPFGGAPMLLPEYLHAVGN